jgi:Flp pilus assembly protein TadD
MDGDSAGKEHASLMRGFGTESSRSLERETAAADAQGSRGAWGPLSILVQIAAWGLITVPAWLLGGVQAETQVWLFVVAACAMLACWGVCLGRAMSLSPLPVVLVPLALAVVLGILQTLSLPAPVHRWVSPRTQQWWRDLNPTATTGSESADSGGDSVSLYPASTRRELSLLVLAVAAFVLGATVLAGRLAFSIAGVAIAINGAALAFFGLAQQLTWNGLLYWSIPLTGGGTPFASYVNRNNAAGMLNMCLACAIALCVWGIVHVAGHAGREKGVRNHLPGREKGVRNHLPEIGPAGASHKWFLTPFSRFGTKLLLILARLNAATVTGLILAGCIAAGVFCSLSRGGTLAMLGAAMLTLLAAALAGRWRRGWLGPMLVTGVAACLLVGYVGQGDRVQQRLATLLDESARQSDGRLVNWQDGWLAAGDLLPAGSGLGTYRYIYQAYQQQPNSAWFYHAENQYLQALVEAGLPGLGLLLAALGLVALACWRLLQRAPDAATYALGVAGTFALSSQAIHAVFDFGLYLPANMLLLAMICGAVCGRAARIEGSLWRSSDGSVRWSAWLVALPPLRPLAASCCVALAGLLLLGGVEARRAVAVEAALADARQLDLQRPQPVATLDRSLNRFDVESANGVQDVEAQLKLAQLWINRLRGGLVEAIRQDAPAGIAESAIWAATDTTYLHGRLQQWSAQQRTAEAVELRNAPCVLENLPHAIRHLRQARDLCPLLPEIHLLLAQLTVLAAEDADNQADLQRVRLTAPGQPAILNRCGLLELQAGRVARACECWRASLALDAGQLPAILPVARPGIDLAAHIGDMVPDSPEMILDIADAQFSSPADRPIRQALLAKAETLASSRRVDDAQASWLRGRIALLRNDARRAVAYFTQAVTMRPNETAWRYELAVALQQSGRYPEAREQARLCVGTEPGNERYEALLREVIREQIAPKRRTRTDT